MYTTKHHELTFCEHKSEDIFVGTLDRSVFSECISTFELSRLNTDCSVQGLNLR